MTTQQQQPLATTKPANWQMRADDTWDLDLAIDCLHAAMRPVDMPLAERHRLMECAADHLDQIRLGALAKTVRAVLAGAHSSLLLTMLDEAFGKEIEEMDRRWHEANALLRRRQQEGQA